MKTISKLTCLTALVLVHISGGVTVPAAEVTLSINPQGELEIANGTTIANVNATLTGSVFNDNCCNLMRTLYVNDLYVQRVHEWDGISIMVPQFAPASSAQSTNASAPLETSKESDTASVMKHVSALQTELKNKTIEINELRQAVAELKKSVMRLESQTK